MCGHRLKFQHTDLTGKRAIGLIGSPWRQTAAQPAFAEPGEEPFPRVAGLTGRRVEPDEHRLADKS
jgi:hypothetical protein